MDLEASGNPPLTIGRLTLLYYLALETLLDGVSKYVTYRRRRTRICVASVWAVSSNEYVKSAALE